MMGDADTVNEFHKLYYTHPEQTIYDTHWLGVAAQKYPSDLWVYQEILVELQPDFIIETGTYWGGSALFLAGVCELLGHGQVVTIDSVDMAESSVTRPEHPRITYLHGSSIESGVVDRVREIVAGAEKVMVILDSDHSREHVLNELKIYSDFVTPESYLIVEDTNINGHPVFPEFGPGPMEALDLFLTTTSEFLPDPSREKFFVTANPRGFLRRVEEGGLQARFLEAEQKLAEQQARAEEAETLARMHDALGAERATQIAELEAELAARQAELAAKQAELEAELAARQVELAAKEAQIAATQATQRELEELLDAADVARRSVENSASWRLTSVFRNAKRFIKGDG